MFPSDLQVDLGVSDNDGRTALHYSVTGNSLPSAQAIMEAMVGGRGLCATPFSVGVVYIMCHALLNGCGLFNPNLVTLQPNDINLVDKENGWSALHLACGTNTVDIATLLASHPRSVNPQ